MGEGRISWVCLLAFVIFIVARMTVCLASCGDGEQPVARNRGRGPFVAVYFYPGRSIIARELRKRVFVNTIRAPPWLWLALCRSDHWFCGQSDYNFELGVRLDIFVARNHWPLANCNLRAFICSKTVLFGVKNEANCIPNSVGPKGNPSHPAAHFHCNPRAFCPREIVESVSTKCP